MPQVPTPSDVYLVVPLAEGGVQGAAQVYAVEASDMDDAARIVLDQGFNRVAVVLGTRYTEEAA